MAKKKEEADAERKALQKELTREAKKANALLQRLNAQMGSTNTYAGKKLIDRLSKDNVQGLTSKGFIRYGSDLSVTQMRAILTATKQFTASKTSTIQGIKETAASVKESLAINFDITLKEADTLYQFFGSKEFTNKEIENIKSEIFRVGIESAKNKDNAADFINQLENYVINGVDEDLKKELRTIYNKYFKPKPTPRKKVSAKKKSSRREK